MLLWYRSSGFDTVSFSSCCVTLFYIFRSLILFFFIHFFFWEAEKKRGLGYNNLKLEKVIRFQGGYFESCRGHHFRFLRISLINCLNLNENRSFLDNTYQFLLLVYLRSYRCWSLHYFGCVWILHYFSKMHQTDFKIVKNILTFFCETIESGSCYIFSLGQWEWQKMSNSATERLETFRCSMVNQSLFSSLSNQV